VKKIAIIGTVLPFENKGDEAIYRSSIKLVREHYPNCKLLLAPAGFEIKSPKLFQFQESEGLVDEILPHPLTFINATFEKLFHTSPSNKLMLRLIKICSYNFSPYSPALMKYIKNSKMEFIDEYEDIDLFIILGHPLEKVGLPTYMASYFYPKFVLKKTTVVFPLSLSLMKYSKVWIIDKMIRKYTKALLKKMDIILFREKKSMEYFVENMRTNTNALLSADMAFLLGDSDFASVSNKLVEQSVSFEKPGIAICLRNDYFTRYKGIFTETEVNLLLKCVAKLLDNLIEKYSFNVYFVPMSVDDDVIFSKWCRKLIRRKHMAHIVDTRYMDCTEVKTLLSNMDFVITMRIHGAILAGASHVPSISLMPSCDLKSVGIMDDMCLGDYHVDLLEPNLAIRLLPFKVEQLYRNIDKVVNDIKNRIPIIQSRAEKAAEILRYFP